MSATPWMEFAGEQEGASVAEIGGPQAHKSIVAYFAAIGRPDITSDEIAWCAAFYFWCLMKAGVDISSVPKDKILLAVSGLLLGTRIDGPRYGAARISKRYDNSGKVVGHHIAFVKSWTKTHVELTGGNQSNSVSTAWFKRNASDVYIWPPAPVSVQEVAQVSRIADAAGDVRKDATKTGVSQGLETMLPKPPEQLPGVETIANHAGAFKSTVLQMQDFALFSWGKVWWIAAALALFWLVRMAWNAGWIRWWRTEDHNSGKSVIAEAPAAATDDPALWEADNVEAA